MSPYLFILLIEIISMSFARAKSLHNIAPLRLAQEATGITHFLHVNNLVVFFNIDLNQGHAIKDVQVLL